MTGGLPKLGTLPKTLCVDGVDRPINSDYRAALAIFDACNARELSPLNKMMSILEIVYDFDIPENTEEALQQAMWFLDVGSAAGKHDGATPRTLDYRHDEQLLFSAVNAVASHDVREDEYMHWWTFYGLCQAISSDSFISHIVGVRHKLAMGKRLEKHEQEFYRSNKSLIDLQANEEDYWEMVKQLGGGD